MHLLISLLFSILPAATAIFGMGRMQSVAVAGRVFCNGFPVAGIRVKLYDTDILWDSKLDEKHTNIMGMFMLSGHKREFSSIEPALYIYHRCNYNGPCLKKSEIAIPRHFITDGKVPVVTADLGPINLNGRFTDDSVDCIN